MSLSFDQPKKKHHFWIFFLALVVLILVFSKYSLFENLYESQPVQSRPIPGSFSIKEHIINKIPDTLQRPSSTIVELNLTQSPLSEGISPNELSVKFDSAVSIKGFLVNLVSPKEITEGKLAIGLNKKPAYNTAEQNNVFYHTTFLPNGLDTVFRDAFFLPEPVRVQAEDTLNIGAWIQNKSSQEESIVLHLIIYYSWNP